MFYETPLEEIVNFQESEPCVFYIRHGQGWHRDASRKLVRDEGALTFEVLDRSIQKWTRVRMALEDDGFYHWRSDDGHRHWSGFLSETQTHAYLTGTDVNPGGHGVQIFVWPKA